MGILERIEAKVDLIMAAQDDINAAVTALTAFLSDLSADVTAIKNELASTAPAVDTSKLNALVAQIPAAQSAIDALANPTTTTPPPVSSSATAGPAA